LAFWVTEYGDACCADEDTGTILWKHEFEGQFYASIVAAGDRVYFSNHDGTTYVVAAERDFRLMATNRLPDLTLATPALVGDRMIIRGEHSLRCLKE
jgi:outer membrane protein assembly factor BamB